jgi:adenine-specific DNA glycosylase
VILKIHIKYGYLEIILQQTRGSSRNALFMKKFIENFPTVQELAAADEETVLRLAEAGLFKS